MTHIYLVLILILPNGHEVRKDTPQPNLSVCQLELGKLYKKMVRKDETFVLYCTKK